MIYSAGDTLGIGWIYLVSDILSDRKPAVGGSTTNLVCDRRKWVVNRGESTNRGLVTMPVTVSPVG